MRSRMLSPDMKRIIEQQRLGFVATAAPDGTPNLSPKGTFVVLDDATIAFGEIRSPGTIRNLRENALIEVNFVDPFVRKGYRFTGTKALPLTSPAYDDGKTESELRRAWTLRYRKLQPNEGFEE